MLSLKIATAGISSPEQLACWTGFLRIGIRLKSREVRSVVGLMQGRGGKVESEQP